MAEMKYRHMLLGVAAKGMNISAFTDFDIMTHNFLDDIVSAQIDGKGVFEHTIDNNRSKIPYSITYQDPTRVCYSKTNGLKDEKKAKYVDGIGFDINRLSAYTRTSLEIYVHPPGQLTKAVGKTMVKLFKKDDFRGLNATKLDGSSNIPAASNASLTASVSIS